TDLRRGFIARLGSPRGGGLNEGEVEGLPEGDLQDYTRTFPARYLHVWLPPAEFKLPVSKVTPEKVTTDPTVMAQTTVPLGTFYGSASGQGFNQNVPLTDGAGNPIILHLAAGVQTLRVNERVTGNDSDATGNILQNYMVFAPVPN